MGTHLRVLSECYPMNTNMTGLRWIKEVASAGDRTRDLHVTSRTCYHCPTAPPLLLM